MNKSAALLLVVCALLLGAVFAQDPKIAISFKDSNKPFAEGLPTVVTISLENIRLSATTGQEIRFTAKPSDKEMEDFPDQDWTPPMAQ
jgi:hypothetical protein